MVRRENEKRKKKTSKTTRLIIQFNVKHIATVASRKAGKQAGGRLDNTEQPIEHIEKSALLAAKNHNGFY